MTKFVDANLAAIFLFKNEYDACTSFLRSDLKHFVSEKATKNP